MSHLDLILNKRPTNAYAGLKNMPHFIEPHINRLRDVVGHLDRLLKLPDLRPSKYLLGVNRGAHYKKQSPQPSVAAAAPAGKSKSGKGAGGQSKVPASLIGDALKAVVAGMFSRRRSSPYRPPMVGIGLPSTGSGWPHRYDPS